MPYGTQQPSGGFGGDNTWQNPNKNNPSKKRFTSYDRSDATGLDYAVNRFYQSAQGRFTQVDPIGMSAASLSDPQSLNLYSYCGNDPINHTDPDGLFFGWLKRALNAIGKFFSAIGKAILRVLNNKWVSLGFTILSAAVGLFGATNGIFKLLSKAATKVLSAAINYYNKAKDIAGMLSLAGKALQGQFKEIGLALAGALPAIIEDSVMREVSNVWHSPQQRFSLGAYLKAIKDGFEHGWTRLKEVFSREGWRRFIPVYGFFCGPGYGDSALADGIEGVDGVDGNKDSGGCQKHDQEYRRSKNLPGDEKNSIRLTADKDLLGDFFTQTTKGRLIDKVIGVSVGHGYRMVGIPAFGGLILYRSAKK